MYLWWSLFFLPLYRSLVLWAAEMAPPESEKRKLPVWAIVLIVIGVAIICLPICTIVILALLGPSLANVFQSITDSI